MAYPLLVATPTRTTVANAARPTRERCYARSACVTVEPSGARSVLARAKQLQRAGRPVSRLQQWACRLEQRVGHNKATCALANKLARICWAVWQHERDFDPAHLAV